MPVIEYYREKNKLAEVNKDLYISFHLMLTLRRADR